MGGRFGEERQGEELAGLWPPDALLSDPAALRRAQHGSSSSTLTRPRRQRERAHEFEREVRKQNKRYQTEAKETGGQDATSQTYRLARRVAKSEGMESSVKENKRSNVYMQEYLVAATDSKP